MAVVICIDPVINLIILVRVSFQRHFGELFVYCRLIGIQCAMAVRVVYNACGQGVVAKGPAGRIIVAHIYCAVRVIRDVISSCRQESTCTENGRECPRAAIDA